MIVGLLNHLWQSTLFAAAIALLTLALRNNAARIRYGLWFIASLKFLVPFALLAAAGGVFAPAMPPLTMPHLQFMQQTAQPFAATAIRNALPAPSGPDPLALWFGLWFCGFSGVLLVWVVRWSHIRAVLRERRAVAGCSPHRGKGHQFLSRTGTVRHLPAGSAVAARHRGASDATGNARHPGP